MNVKSKYKNITNKLFKKKNKIKKNTIIINTPDNIPSNELNYRMMLSIY